MAVIDRKGRATADVLAEILPEAIAKLPWPKSMRWPGAGALRWVRPLHGIVATLDGEVVPFELRRREERQYDVGPPLSFVWRDHRQTLRRLRQRSCATRM